MKKLFCNGTIITMDGGRIASAVLTENGVIRMVGGEEVTEYGGDAERIDLRGQTMLPAFIDAHSHISSYASSFLQAQLESAASFSDIVDILRAYEKENALEPEAWIMASGYDHNALTEKAHPTKTLLDAAFPGRPVVVQHKSGHFGVFSETALKAVGFSGRDDDGYLEENDFVEAVRKAPMPAPAQFASAYKKAQERYASYGITTVQEGMMVAEMLPLYSMLLGRGLFSLDVVGYPSIAEADRLYDALSDYSGQYRDHFRLGGYKIILDGSPQGRTAWMKTPYAGTTDCYGVSSMSSGDVEAALKKALAEKRQLLAHCNGDAAAEQLLLCAMEQGESIASIRPVMIHAQLLAVDQLPRVKALGVIPSFFVAHCYYWGDTHIENFTFERAKKISPAASAAALGIPFTFHQDTPVLPPDMMRTVWCAVNRKTKNGVTLGAEERISVYDALKAVNVNAAYQYGEENEKGSITEGKKADFAVLNGDPLKCAPEKLNDIAVIGTYKDGERIFQA